jgi:Domain of unknown function (DUF4214)
MSMFGNETPSQHGVEEFLSLKGEMFVASIYRSFLHRAPDPSGLDFYLRRLQTGIAKQQVLAEIAASREAQRLAGRDVDLCGLLRKARKANSWSNRLRRRVRGETKLVNAIRFEVELLEGRLERLTLEVAPMDNRAQDDYSVPSLGEYRAGDGPLRERARLDKAFPNGFSPRLGPAAAHLLSSFRP